MLYPFLKFPMYRQLDQMDCGPACLKMISRYYGKNYTLNTLRQYCSLTREGVSFTGLIEAAKQIGFDNSACKLSFVELKYKSQLPCIIHWNQNHFVVVPPQNFSQSKTILIHDPARGRIKCNVDDFLSSWVVKDTLGIALLLTPGTDFDHIKDEQGIGFDRKFLFKYFKGHNKSILKIITIIILGSLISFAIPF